MSVYYNSNGFVSLYLTVQVYQVLNLAGVVLQETRKSYARGRFEFVFSTRRPRNFSSQQSDVALMKIGNFLPLFTSSVK